MVGSFPTSSLEVSSIARKVKCQITGEYGTSDEFYKASNNKYYKSEDIYNTSLKEKNLWNEIIQLICEELLNYQEWQVFPSLIVRKLAEYKSYDREVILLALQKAKKDLLYQLNIDGKFKDDNGKVFYIFAVLRNTINDVQRDWKREQRVAIKQEKKVEIDDIELDNQKLKTKAKDLSIWFGDE